MSVPTPKRWEPLSLIPVAAGIYWLLAGAADGWLLWGIVPGALMLATGMGLLLWPGDLRLTEYMALGSLLGGLLLLPIMLFGDFGDAVLGGLLAAGAFLVSGHVAIGQEQAVEGVPAPEATLTLAAKTALDEALLAYFVGMAKLPSGDEALRICEKLPLIEAAVKAGGWFEHPERLHPAPPAPEGVRSQQARLYGQTYEHVSYASAYQPEKSIPGAELWAGHTDNAQAAAWVLRHPGPPRPWLVCIHGYRMGHAWMDFGLFPPAWLHERLGLNLIMPVLPLHGPRRLGLLSGNGYLDGDPFDLLFAQSQALWDLRRAVGWVRSQEEHARVGVLGYSLGGYNAALLAQYEKELDFVVAGIPAVDFASALWRHLQPWHRNFYAKHGLTVDRYSRLLMPVSPLARKPLLERERLYLFAGVADRVVLPEHVVALSKHWDVPVQWYQGAHLTFRYEPVVRAHIEAAMQRAGWPVSARVMAVPQEDRG